MKMEAYDTAVLSYALATATGKLKPGLLGMAPALNSISAVPTTRPDDVSLTPPRPDETGSDIETTKKNAIQLLTKIHEALINKNIIPLHQLIGLSVNSRQLDTQGGNFVDKLQHELKQICKVQPGIIYQLDLNEGDDSTIVGSLKNEQVCVALAELLRHYGFNESANLLWSQYF